MEIPRHWRLKKQRYGLMGEVCPRCDYKMFPPRDVCPNCGDEAKELYTFGASSNHGEAKLEEMPKAHSQQAPN